MSGSKAWIISFLLKDGDNKTPLFKCIALKDINAVMAALRGDYLIRKKFPGQEYYIHNIALAADDDLQCDEEVYDDNIGWCFEDIEDWEW